MRAIVEWDGVLADARATYWRAYSDAVAAIGFARTDEATFWRLIRKGANAGELIRGAKPRHIEAYQQHFAAALESDETIALTVPYEGAVEQLREMCKRVAIVTTGANIAARRRVATSHDGTRSNADNPSRERKRPDHGPRDRASGSEGRRGFAQSDSASSHAGEHPAVSCELTHLAPPLTATLRACAAEFGPGSPVIVLAATESLTRAADEAELLPIGIASGACGAKRLATRGARATFPTLDAFLQAHQSADPPLTALGINPPPAPITERRNAQNPRPTLSREAAREARRQARVSRRNPKQA